MQDANLEGAILTGADLREANLRGANLRNADLTYSNLKGAGLRESILYGAALYPAETIGAKFCGAKLAPDSDAAEYSRMAQQEMHTRTGIKPGSVAYRRLQRINGWTILAPSLSPRHPSGEAGAPLFRGEPMNPVAKAILRVVAATAGTAYFLSTFYLVASVVELKTTQMIGWYGTVLGQAAIGLILVGIGLGVVSIRFGREN